MTMEKTSSSGSHTVIESEKMKVFHWAIVSMVEDEKAAERMKIKLQGKAARRAIRYQRFGVNRGAAKRNGT